MIEKETQDLLWSVLSKKDKKNIKKEFSITTDNSKWDDAYNAALVETFGLNNLTSDIEENEILTIPRKTIQKIYSDNCVEIHRECVSESDRDCYEAINEVLKTMFGSKCQLDEKSDADETHSGYGISLNNLPKKNDFSIYHQIELIKSQYLQTYREFINSPEKTDTIIIMTDITSKDYSKNLNEHVHDLFKSLGFENEDIRLMYSHLGTYNIELNVI